MDFYVYILQCSDESLYTGYTDNLKKRVAVHNGDEPGLSAKYTRSRRPVQLVYSESFQTKSEAMQREVAIKKLTRLEKLSPIKDARR